MSKAMLLDIQRAKGLAIFLVVAGHIISNAYPEGNKWYFYFRTAIYQFHMPFFMFISGYIMYYSFREFRSVQDYLYFVRKKATRFIIPYLLFLGIIFAGKYFAGKIFSLENPVSGYESFLTGLIRPMDSFSRSLWYIYVLFLYYLTIPVLFSFLGHRWELLIASGVLYFLPLSNVLGMDQYREYLFIFLLGTFAVRYREIYCRWLDQTAGFSLLIFLVVIFVNGAIGLPKWYVGLMSVPALHALVRYSWTENRLGLEILGKYTYPIYLMNTMAIGLFRVIFKKYGLWDGNAFFIAVPILMLSGILIPILVQRYIISKTPILNRVIY